jgi:hypothetical protein
MASLKQIEANRRNALRSTGPKTPEGKAAVRHNSLRHGLRASLVVLPGENCKEFDQLCEDLEKDWQPETQLERIHLERMAVNHWQLVQLHVRQNSLLEQVDAKEQARLLDMFLRAQNRLERAFDRAQLTLQRLQKERRTKPPEPDELGPGLVRYRDVPGLVWTSDDPSEPPILVAEPTRVRIEEPDRRKLS